MRLIASAPLSFSVIAALAACGPTNAPTPAAAAPDASPAAFPSLTNASYRAETVHTAGDAKTSSLVQYRAGAKLRLEFSTGDGAMASIADPEAGEAYTISPARRLAIRVPIAQLQNAMLEWAALGADGVQPTPTGACAVAGEAGAGWSLPASEGKPERTACISADGIFLQGTESGRITWEVTSLARGPQDPALFVVPPGYRVEDMSPEGAPR